MENANHAAEVFFGLGSDFSGWLTGGVSQCEPLFNKLMTESCSGLVSGYSGWFRADWITEILTEIFNPTIDSKF